MQRYKNALSIVCVRAWEIECAQNMHEMMPKWLFGLFVLDVRIIVRACVCRSACLQKQTFWTKWLVALVPINSVCGTLYPMQIMLLIFFPSMKRTISTTIAVTYALVYFQTYCYCLTSTFNWITNEFYWIGAWLPHSSANIWTFDWS